MNDILSNMQNFEAHTRSSCEAPPKPGESTLFREEIDVIVAIVHHIAAKYLRSPQGTFILDGQPHNHPAHCTCRFNLKNGPCRREFFGDGRGDSDDLAAEAINQLLKSGSERTRYRDIWPHDFDNTDGCKCVGGGIFGDGNLNVMVLNCTHGKFLAASYLNVDSNYFSDGNIAILVAVATAFSEMMREDITLQRSFGKIRQVYDFCYLENIQEVQRLFTQKSLPELKKWSQWHEPANSSGKFGLPFEEYFKKSKSCSYGPDNSGLSNTIPSGDSNPPTGTIPVYSSNCGTYVSSTLPLSVE